MGEVANDMLRGLCCSYCGVYFVKAHEYPVLCRECASQVSADQMRWAGLQLTLEEEEV